MRIKFCFMAGIFGIAVAAGLLESLSTPRNSEKRKREATLETKEKAGQ
jgi:hypothetical protein